VKKLKVAVIGTGHLGRFHARIYSELKSTDLVAVCDVDKKRAKEVARHYGTEPVYDYRDLLGKVEAASIATPTNLHYKIAKDFIQNKVHVLVEKPITSNLQEADRLLKAAEKNKVLLQVGHIERFNAAVEAVKKIITKPKFIECHRLGPYNRRSIDVGVVLDLMIHDIDIILSLVKSKIKKIDAVGVSVLSDYEDIANARLIFENKAICNITSSRISEEIVRKIRIFQKDAYVSLDYVSQQAEIYKKTKNKIVKQSIDITKQEPLKAEIQSFVESIIKRRRPVVSGEDAKAALKTALMITKKIKSRKRWTKK
jgi:predicted dehydrogenase